MPTNRQTLSFRAVTLLAAAATLGCAEPPHVRAARPPMAIYLTIHNRLEGTSPVQVAVGRSRIWNAPAPRLDVAPARATGGHFRVSADTVRIIATLDDGRPCRRRAVLEPRREAWLDVVLEPGGCAIQIRYDAPAVDPDSAPWLKSQILLIAGAAPGLPDEARERLG